MCCVITVVIYALQIVMLCVLAIPLLLGMFVGWVWDRIEACALNEDRNYR